jgi:hypothetical protein
MLITIKGTYENGKITLQEKPPFDYKVNVLVTFLEEEIIDTKTLKPRVSGSLKGKIRISDDFNEPLEDSPTKRRQAGGLGKVWYADDFDTPLEDLKDYM